MKLLANAFVADELSHKVMILTKQLEQTTKELKESKEQNVKLLSYILEIEDKRILQAMG